METVIKPKKNQELAKRARKMVRLISRMAFVCPNGLFLVDGEPEVTEFLKCLQSHSTAPEPGQVPTPAALGFSPEQVLRVTMPLLADFGHALQKWRKIIREKDTRRVRKREEAERLQKWKGETEVYGRRLERLHALLRETHAGNPVRTAYVLLDADPEEADSIIHKASVGLHLPEALRWMGQVVFWLGGGIALRRFLAVPEMLSLAEKQRIEAVQRFKAGLMEIETRFTTEGMPFRFQDVPDHRKWDRRPAPSNTKITFQNAGAVKDYIQDLFDQEKQAVAVLGIKPPRRPRDLGEYLFTISERCNAWLEKGFKASSDRQTAGIAALCALDSSAVPIPRHLMGSHAEERFFSRFIRDLVKISNQPGYDGLLIALNDFGLLSIKYDYDVKPDVLRRLILTGASAEDLHWLLKHDGFSDISDSTQLHSESLAEAGINPAPLRRLVKHLNKLGADCSSGEIRHALDFISHFKDIRPAEAFDAWLAELPQKRSDPAFARRTWHTFLDILNLSGFGPQYRHLMDQWFSAKPLRDAFAGMITPEMDEQTLWQLELLARYQQLAGQKVRLTGRLKRLLEAEIRISAELAYLEQQEAAGSLTAAMRKRLHYLRSWEKYEPSFEKVLRKAVELSAITALEGLRDRIDKETSDLWNRFTAKNSMQCSISQGNRTEILRWANTLDSKHKAGLQEILDAWAEAETHYKMRLASNRKWLEKARSSLGIGVEKWLYPSEQEVALDGKPVRLRVANDPFQIFLMGSYFDTCLALDKGCNRDTVLSNAYEASKQVLYATDADGVVLARKLVGITPGGAMVGFRTYLAGRVVDRDELTSHIHAFCGTWAGACGAGLAGLGIPERISDLFWHNDGLETWLPFAFVAHRVIVDGFVPSKKPMCELLEKYWTDCVRILEELGLWPIEDAETPEMMFRHRRGLAEELLAEVALDRRDLDLLKHIEGFVSTAGGWLQTLKVRASLDPDQMTNTLQITLNWNEQPHYKMAGKIMQLRLLCEAETAFDRLLEEFIDPDGYMHGVLNVVLALRGKPERARKLRQRMTRWVLPHYNSGENTLTLLHAADTADGATCSDNLICRLIYAHISEYSNCIPALAQWLPALKKPQGLLGDALQAAWSDSRLTESEYHPKEDVRINLVVWCLRNPSAAATAFLRKQSDHHPAALLGLALAEPLRYRQQIQKAAGKMAPNPAAALAVLMSLGHAAGAGFLATLPGYTKQPELVENTIRMMQAIDALNWQACAAVPGFSKKKLHHCLPLIMLRIWDSLSEPAGTAGVDQLHTTGAAGFLKKAGVGVYGLCLNIVAGLHQYHEEVVNRLCLGVRRLFLASGRYGIPGEFRLWLNDLSGDRLFAANAPDVERYKEKLEFDDPQCSNLYPLLFTENGERRPVCRLPWIDRADSFGFPFSRQDVARFAELLVEKLYPQKCFIAAEVVSTVLELEGLLLDHYVKKYEAKNNNAD